MNGLIDCLFLFMPGTVAFFAVRHLIRRGFFGPHQ